MVISFFSSSFLFGINSLVHAAEVDSIPNTTRNFKDYDNSYLSVTGYASSGVKDRSHYIDTSYYRQVKTEREFLQAILTEV